MLSNVCYVHRIRLCSAWKTYWYKIHFCAFNIGDMALNQRHIWFWILNFWPKTWDSQMQRKADEFQWIRIHLGICWNINMLINNIVTMQYWYTILVWCLRTVLLDKSYGVAKTTFSKQLKNVNKMSTKYVLLAKKFKENVFFSKTSRSMNVMKTSCEQNCRIFDRPVIFVSDHETVPDFAVFCHFSPIYEIKCDEIYVCWVIKSSHLGKFVVKPPKCFKFMICNNVIAQKCKNE